jgi:hypothetical protein
MDEARIIELTGDLDEAQRYLEQTWIVGAAPAPVPQAHLAVACWPSAQAPSMCLCA